MRRHTVRILWVTLGVISLALGAAGVILPLLPTTPFVLLAAFAFARSSPRLHDWLMSHPRFGRQITNWQRYGAIERRTKITAVLVLVATPFVTWAIGAPAWALLAQIVVLAIVGLFIVTRPEGKASTADSETC